MPYNNQCPSCGGIKTSRAALCSSCRKNKAQEDVNRAAELRKEGHTYSEIADLVGVPRKTIETRLKKAGLTIPGNTLSIDPRLVRIVNFPSHPKMIRDTDSAHKANRKLLWWAGELGLEGLYAPKVTA